MQRKYELPSSREGEDGAERRRAWSFATRPFRSPVFCFAALLAFVIYAAVSTSDTGVRESGTSPDEVCFHTSRIDGIAFSPDGRVAASACIDGTTKVWDVATRRPRPIRISGISGFSGVTFSPDGRTLALAGLDGKVVLCDLSNGRIARRFVANETVGSLRAAVFSPDGDTLATGGDDRAVHLWDIPSGHERLVMRGHDATVKGLAYMPDGKSIISVSADGRAISWDTRTGQARERVDGGCGPLWSVAVSRDGRWAVLGGTVGITLLDLGSGRTRPLRSPRSTVTSLCFLPCGTILASASLDGSITLWKEERGEFRHWRAVGGLTSRLRALAVSPDGKTLVSGGDDAFLRFWNIPILAQDGIRGGGQITQM